MGNRDGQVGFLQKRHSLSSNQRKANQNKHEALFHTHQLGEGREEEREGRRDGVKEGGREGRNSKIN